MNGLRLFTDQLRAHLEVYDWFQTLEVACRRLRAFVVSK